MAKLERETITDTTIGTTAELASLIGVSTRRVQQLTAEGILPQVNKGHYLLAASVQAYLSHKMGETLSPEELSIERRRREADTVLKESKAKIARLEAEVADNNYHRAEDVEEFMEALIFEMRGILISLPGRLAVDVAHSTNAAECGEIIKQEVYQAMRALSNWFYDPAYYREKEEARRNWRNTIQQDLDAELAEALE